MRIGMTGPQPDIHYARAQSALQEKSSEQTTAETDTVQFSDLSREKLAQMADSQLAAEIAEEASYRAGREQKLDDVRKKIAEGYYNNPDVLRKIAERITDNNEENL
jgi:anti-sigma28 factor (negative regulator of flagellin synthesis)